MNALVIENECCPSIHQQTNQFTEVEEKQIMNSRTNNNHQLHFLLIPFLSQSHIIPLTDFAKLLAQHGVTVSIITTPQNAIRYQAMNEYSKSHDLKIHLISIDFPNPESSGLPRGCENLDSLTSMEFARSFFRACEMLQPSLENLIHEMELKPSCVVSTNALPWTQKLAERFEIPRYVFETVSCFTLACSQHIAEAQESVSSDSEPFSVPDIPHTIEFTRAQLPKSAKSGSDDGSKNVIDDMKRVLNRSRGTIVNSFLELEPWYVEECRRERRRVWCIGPVSLSNTELSERSTRGNKPSVDELHILSWLSSMKPKSVIYACFGSLCRLSFPQIKEVCLGLESSNSPFILVVRDQEYCSGQQVENWLATFERRRTGGVMIIRGWAPQVLILSHPSIGGFLTHCGWNSTLEGICAGVPMITWPMFAEQFYNEKFVVDVLRVGVRIGVEVCEDYDHRDDEAMVKRDQVTDAIEQVMDSEAWMIRQRAEELAVISRKALEKGGSSYNDVLMLIQDVLLLMQCSKCNGKVVS